MGLWFVNPRGKPATAKGTTAKAATRPPYYRGAGGTMPPGALAQDPHARLEQIPESHVAEAEAYESIYVFLQSSMCRGCQYFRLTEQLQVDWVDGGGGIYDDVSPEEFRDFMAASSKGGWVHDHLVGRGHKKGEPSLKHYTPL